ncbi:T9SS type A sorting domain-containing protein [Rhodocaloribacter litoris]|uniref:carboxypeptidase regulatory-like domain-containing protein n=1 Tax=Rhodocaloribacter litoris TaxID=2558931 RepID=UPI0014238922|nr:carboxypeptidase regulatory-like domain-containing protein [Rhodocaloribacter litoris]QXD15531.1 T9SS type A sorting domain-containing protein [Rhodocaloribacter litoris]
MKYFILTAAQWRLHRLVLSLWLLYPATAIHAQIPSTQEDSVNKVARYLVFNDKEIAARVDEATGTPSWVISLDSIDFNLGVPEVLITPEAVVRKTRAFLQAHQTLLKVDPDRLSEPTISTDGRFWFITYSQEYKGLPVIGSQIGLTITREGRLFALGVQAYPDLALNTTPSLGASSAAQLARNHAGLDRDGELNKQQLVILAGPAQGRYEYKLAWKLVLEDFTRATPVSKSFLVDAHQGTVLRERDNFLHVEPSFNTHSPTVSMVSSVPDDSPLDSDKHTLLVPPFALPLKTGILENGDGRSSGSVAGTVTLNYYDTPDDIYTPLIRRYNRPFKGAKVQIKNNATGATRTTYADTNGFYAFSGLDSGSHTVTFFIENDQARINSGVSTSKKEKSFTINVSGAVQLNYDWGWGDDGDVDQSTTAMGLNAVHQIKVQHEYVRNTLGYTGMDGLPVRQVYVYQTIPKNENGGSTRPWWQEIYLRRHYALSSEVAHHEYMHNIIYELYNGNMISWLFSGGDPDYDAEEAAAMDEGFADYFTCSRTGNATYGGPVDLANDPSFPPGEGVVVRFLWNDCTMNDFDGEWPCGGSPHSRGRIISGAVWRVRTDIGSAADELAFLALQIAPQPQSFSSFGERMYVADDMLNGGANRAVIEQRFVERLILPPLAPSSLFALSGSGGDVHLSWNDRSSLENGYDVQRRLNGGTWSAVASLAADATSFTDQHIFCRTGSNDYEYRIRVYKDALEDFSPIRYYNPCGPQASVAVSGQTLDADIHQADPVTPDVPVATLLEGAYPNPFSPYTTIRYTLASATHVHLAVYDMLGREVALLVNRRQKPGQYEAFFKAENLPSGPYLYRLVTKDQQFSGTMLFVK